MSAEILTDAIGKAMKSYGDKLVDEMTEEMVYKFRKLLEKNRDELVANLLETMKIETTYDDLLNETIITVKYKG